MQLDKIIKFAKENKWIIIAAIFFIAWKFFLISILWHDRISPPEPDDSYIYIANIESVRNCESYILCSDSLYSLNNSSGFEHLSYRLFWGSLAKILNLDSVKTFHLSFYLGTLILVPVLIFFLRYVNPNKKIIAFSLFFLAFFNGAGSYHGFFWVVPSFFTLLLFILIFTIIASGVKHNKFFLVILTPIFAFNHSLGIYLALVIPIYFLIISTLSKKIHVDLLKRTVFFLFIFALVYVPYISYLSYNSQANPYSVNIVAKKVIQNIFDSSEATSDTNNPSTTKIKDGSPEAVNSLPGFNQIKENYLNWFFFNWLGLLLSIILISVLFIYKQRMILSIYIASFIFMIISSLSPYADRSLLLIWPITFIIYSQGLYFIIELFKEDNMKNKTIRIFSYFFIVLFVLINAIYSFDYNYLINKKNNFEISSFNNYILTKIAPPEKIYLDSGTAKILTAYAVIDDKLLNINRTTAKEDATIYITTENEDSENDRLKLPVKFLNLFKEMIGKKINEDESSENKFLIENGFLLEKDFNGIRIYKK